MHPRQQTPPALLRLAEQQEHVLTLEQCLGHGLSRSAIDRLVDVGGWRDITTGVVQTHHLPPPWRARAWAGVLLGGDHARLGGRAAGHVHGFVDAPPEPIQVWVPLDAGVPSAKGWWFRREPPDLRLPTRHFDPPSIGVEDAVLDVVAAEHDRERIIATVATAIRQGLTKAPRLERRMAERTRLRHRALLTEILADVDGGAHSNLEVRYLRDVERAHGLPRGTRQLRRGRTYCDVCYEKYGLIVELDGKLGHTGAGRFRDMTRDNSATAQGLSTLRYGHGDVFGQPCEVAQQVGGVMQARGWGGLITRCRRCVRVFAR